MRRPLFDSWMDPGVGRGEDSSLSFSEYRIIERAYEQKYTSTEESHQIYYAF
jgi:hypothetical protein